MTPKTTTRLGASAAALLLISGTVFAAPDAQSAELLAATVKAIQSSTSHQVIIDVVSKGTVAAPEGPRQIERRISFDLATAQPNKFRRLSMMDGVVAEARVSNGTELTTYLIDLGMYEVVPAPASLKALTSADPMADLSLLPAMLGTDKSDQLISMGDDQVYAGEVTVDGNKARRIDFKTKEGAAYFLLSPADPPRLDRIVMGEGESVTTTYSFKWADSAPADTAFVFQAPEGAKKVASLNEELQKMQEPQDAAVALQGKPAPPVKLTSLQGESVDIASHVGKDVVVLDFWASWCGPCRRALPVIDKLTKEYKDKGVAVYTVNIEDPVDVVQSFLKANKLDVEVLLDKDSAVARAYLASSIPQTVLIDKKGNVVKVHVGISEDYEKELRTELDSLIGATP
ncbi:redoxin domain-containing protein [bacterium]|nr:redoxin domain-containing protein [bacterium]